MLEKNTITAGEIAAMAGGRVDGDPTTPISGFAKIEEAKPGDITFIANPKYAHYIATTEASAVLVSETFDAGGEVRPALIRVADPYKSLADLLTAIESARPRPRGIEQPCFIAEGVEIPDDAYVGAFTYIGKGVKIGAGALIYPQCYLGAGASVGAGTTLRAGVKVYEGCKIGARCIIHSGAVIGADGFGFAPTAEGEYEKLPQTGIVKIADDVEIGANTTVDRATFGATRVGRGTKIDNLVQVAHNVEVGECNVFCAQSGVAGSTKIGSHNRIGGQVGFAGHIKIGDNNDFGAQSGVHANVGNDKRLIGYPATDAVTFARSQVYLRRIGELFEKKK